MTQVLSSSLNIPGDTSSILILIKMEYGQGSKFRYTTSQKAGGHHYKRAGVVGMEKLEKMISMLN